MRKILILVIILLSMGFIACGDDNNDNRDTLAYEGGVLDAGTELVPYNQPVTGATGAVNITYALKDGDTLPNGLTVTLAGSVVGTPEEGSAVNGHTFRVVASALTARASVEAQWTITINPTGSQQSVVYIANPALLYTATVGTAYAGSVGGAIVPATGVTYAITTGSLPNPLELNQNTGAITGMPAASGSFSFTVTASAEGYTATAQEWTLVIQAGSDPLVVYPNTPPLSNGTVGEEYTGNVATATIPASGVTYQLISPNPLPASLIFNANGTITGTPNAVVNGVTITVRASAPNHTSVDATWTLTIVQAGGQGTAVIFEAEDSVIGEPAQREDDLVFASGNAGVGFMNPGASLTWNINSNAAATARMEFRFSSTNMEFVFEPDFTIYIADQQVDASLIRLTVNGTVIPFTSFVVTGNPGVPMGFNQVWTVVSIGDINLIAGDNVIVLSVIAEQGGAPNVDYLRLTSTAALTWAGSGSGGDPVAYDLTADPVKYKVIIGSYELGPLVEGIVLTFANDVDGTSFDETTFRVRVANTARTVTEAYVSDERGNPLAAGTTTSKYITFKFQLTVANNGNAQQSAGAFQFVMSPIMSNIWQPNLRQYQVDVNAGKTFKVGDNLYNEFNLLNAGLSFVGFNYAGGEANTAAGRISPSTETWTVRRTYQLLDNHSSLAEPVMRTLGVTAWEPDVLKNDSGKNPLIIWLHGAGELSTTFDGDIALLGNQVTELALDTVQRHFRTGGLQGAYVVSIQNDSMWMNYYTGGSYGTQSSGSIYTQILLHAIDQYIASNDDIDTDRIYIGGCSNGGYMVLEMLFQRPNFYAAAWPTSHAYEVGNLTPQRLASINNLPIWFTHTNGDTTTNMNTYGQVIGRIIKESAPNTKFFSFLTSNVGRDFPNATYNAHWSWLRALQDRIHSVQNNALVVATADNENATLLAAFTHTAEGGSHVVRINNQNVGMWEWLSAQRRGQTAPVGVIGTP